MSTCQSHSWEESEKAYYPKLHTVLLRKVWFKSLHHRFPTKHYLSIYQPIHVYIYPSLSPGVQVKGEQRAPLHPVSSGPAAGQPGLPAGRAAAQLHQCDAEERLRHAVGGGRRESSSSAIGPLSQHTWIDLAQQRAEVEVVSACGLFFPLFMSNNLSISFFLYCKLYSYIVLCSSYYYYRGCFYIV